MLLTITSVNLISTVLVIYHLWVRFPIPSTQRKFRMGMQENLFHGPWVPDSDQILIYYYKSKRREGRSAEKIYC